MSCTIKKKAVNLSVALWMMASIIAPPSMGFVTAVAEADAGIVSIDTGTTPSEAREAAENEKEKGKEKELEKLRNTDKFKEQEQLTYKMKLDQTLARQAEKDDYRKTQIISLSSADGNVGLDILNMDDPNAEMDDGKRENARAKYQEAMDICTSHLTESHKIDYANVLCSSEEAKVTLAYYYDKCIATGNTTTNDCENIINSVYEDAYERNHPTYLDMGGSANAELQAGDSIFRKILAAIRGTPTAEEELAAAVLAAGTTFYGLVMSGKEVPREEDIPDIDVGTGNDKNTGDDSNTDGNNTGDDGKDTNPDDTQGDGGDTQKKEESAGENREPGGGEGGGSGGANTTKPAGDDDVGTDKKTEEETKPTEKTAKPEELVKASTPVAASKYGRTGRNSYGAASHASAGGSVTPSVTRESAPSSSAASAERAELKSIIGDAKNDNAAASGGTAKPKKKESVQNNGKSASVDRLPKDEQMDIMGSGSGSRKAATKQTYGTKVATRQNFTKMFLNELVTRTEKDNTAREKKG